MLVEETSATDKNITKMPKQKTKSSTMRKRSGTNGIICHERNWSELPEDILHLFSKKLPDILDFIRFRAVCKRWQLSAPVNDPPPQLPWLLEHRQIHEMLENAIIRFYCPWSGKVHTITCPGSRDALLRGPGCHYLLADNVRNFKSYLLNPLTHDQIHVPLYCRFTPDYMGPDPIKGGDIFVMSGHTNMMAFWRSEADDWVYVKGVGGYYSGNAYYMGQYFSSNKDTGITNVVDIATKKLAYQVAPPEGRNPLLEGHTIIVESGGKMLMLFYYSRAHLCDFDIYCLYFGDGEGNPCWVKITDIGDQMLFLKDNRGSSFCASNFAGFKGNCIYYPKWGKIHRYDIGDGTTEELPCPFDSVVTWFVPSLV